MTTLLFSTIHGSHLYGLATPKSDIDFYKVVAKEGRGGSTQRIVADTDINTVDFSRFMELCRKGVPQALEAMFSTKADIDIIKDLRAGYTCGTEVYDTYFRTIKSFALSEGYKKKRHALRLALNLAELAKTGRFNPTLSAEDADYVSRYAYKSHEDVYGLAQCIAW